jgi:hypothetical protein
MRQMKVGGLETMRRQIQLTAIAAVVFLGLTGFVSNSSLVGKWSIKGAAFGCSYAETILQLRNDGTFSVSKSATGCNLPILTESNKDSASGKWALLPADRSTGPLSILKEKTLLDLDYTANGRTVRSSYTVFMHMQDGKTHLKLVGAEAQSPLLGIGQSNETPPLPETLGSRVGVEWDKIN